MANKKTFSEYRRGSYTVMDEKYRDKALDWVWVNSFKKESPNLGAAHFRIWVNDNLPLVVQYHPQVKQQISVSTAT